MPVFVVAVANDPSARSDGPDCAVSLVCVADSRMDAVQRIRALHVTGLASKEVVPLRSVRWDLGELPAVQDGEVWARPVYVKGDWRKLG